ncbi:MAG: HAD-IA family hydrolase [Patescibacteria group bacterium]
MQKPEEKIYELAEKLAQVKPEEIFFVENSQEHVQAAKNRGWQTFLYDPQKPEASMRELQNILELV